MKRRTYNDNMESKINVICSKWLSSLKARENRARKNHWNTVWYYEKLYMELARLQSRALLKGDYEPLTEAMFLLSGRNEIQST